MSTPSVTIILGHSIVFCFKCKFLEDGALSLKNLTRQVRIELHCVHLQAQTSSLCSHARATHSCDRARIAYFDCAIVKNSQQGAEVKILVGAGPRGETFARAVHRKRAKFEDLEHFLKVLQARYGNIPVYCDQEECLREVVHSTAGRLGMPTGVTAVEQSQATGRAEQRVREKGFANPC